MSGFKWFQGAVATTNSVARFLLLKNPSEMASDHEAWNNALKPPGNAGTQARNDVGTSPVRFSDDWLGFFVLSWLVLAGLCLAWWLGLVGRRIHFG